MILHYGDESIPPDDARDEDEEDDEDEGELEEEEEDDDEEMMMMIGCWFTRYAVGRNASNRCAITADVM